MSTDYSEDTLVEQPAIALFEELGYETANCFYEKTGTSGSTLGRETTEEVILVPKLRSALEKLNPGLDGDAINLAIEELARDRSAMSLVQTPSTIDAKDTANTRPQLRVLNDVNSVEKRAKKSEPTPVTR